MKKESLLKSVSVFIFLLFFTSLNLFAVYDEAEYNVSVTGPTVVIQNVSTTFHATVKDNTSKIFYDKDFTRTLKKLGTTVITNTISFKDNNNQTAQIVATYEVTVVDSTAFNCKAIITGPTTVIQNVSTKFHITVKDGLNNIYYDKDFTRTLKKLGTTVITNTVTYKSSNGQEAQIVGTYQVSVVDSSTQIINNNDKVSEPIFTNPITKTNAEEQMIVNAINSAQSSIDVAAYSVVNWPIVNALVDAAKRLGKDKVRIVTEFDNYSSSSNKSYFDKLEAAGITVVSDAAGGGGSGLSHNKFYVIDNEKVLTGSCNATYSGCYLDNNNMIAISSASVASIYETEFKQMFDKKLFGKAKEPSANHDFQYTPQDYKANSNLININTATQDDLVKLYGIGKTTAANIINYRKTNGNFKSVDDLSKVPGIKSSVLIANKRYLYTDADNTTSKSGEIYFAPKDNVKEQIINAINAAKTTIEFAMFTFTDKDIASALAQAQARGVKVTGIYDSDQAGSQYSTYNTLKTGGASVYLDSNENLMHNKYILLDGEKTITGSYNWTASASTENDENIMILNDKSTAINYYNNFKSMIPASS